MPGAQNVEEVARVVADGLRDERTEIYTRPEGQARVAEYFQKLGA
jgi:hypothetical protein